jgi:hypothetical protein
MNDTVSKREHMFNIRRIGDEEKRKSITLADEEEIIKEEDDSTKDDKKENVIAALDSIIATINLKLSVN